MAAFAYLPGSSVDKDSNRASITCDRGCKRAQITPGGGFRDMQRVSFRDAERRLGRYIVANFSRASSQADWRFVEVDIAVSMQTKNNIRRARTGTVFSGTFLLLLIVYKSQKQVKKCFWSKESQTFEAGLSFNCRRGTMGKPSRS